jgi:hypothetical protein
MHRTTLAKMWHDSALSNIKGHQPLTQSHSCVCVPNVVNTLTLRDGTYGTALPRWNSGMMMILSEFALVQGYR